MCQCNRRLLYNYPKSSDVTLHLWMLQYVMLGFRAESLGTKNLYFQQTGGRTYASEHCVALQYIPNPAKSLYDRITVLVLRMADRKWKETKQQPSMLPGPAVPGSCLVSFHIMWAILSTSTVVDKRRQLRPISFSAFN